MIAILRNLSLIALYPDATPITPNLILGSSGDAYINVSKHEVKSPTTGLDREAVKVPSKFVLKNNFKNILDADKSKVERLLKAKQVKPEPAKLLLSEEEIEDRQVKVTSVISRNLENQINDYCDKWISNSPSLLFRYDQKKIEALKFFDQYPPGSDSAAPSPDDYPYITGEATQKKKSAAKVAKSILEKKALLEKLATDAETLRTSISLKLRNYKTPKEKFVYGQSLVDGLVNSYNAYLS